MHLLQSIRNTTVLHRIFWDVRLLLTTLIMESRLRENTNSQSASVTLEGELINPGGSMTGGAFKNTSNLLSRRREIEELEKAVQKLKAQNE